MRKFVKTVAVLALAVSVLSTSAFAALTGSVEGDNGTYTASVTSDVSGEQVTLLAVDQSAVDVNGSEPTLASVTDTNIYYIDQNDSGSFVNFQVKGDSVAGKELFFFAGSASSSAAKYLGNDENLVLSIAAESESTATIEVGGTVVLTTSYSGARIADNEITWTAAKGEVDASTTISNGTVNGATFTGTEEGTYTVTATAKGVTSAPVTITVNAPSYKVSATTTLIKTSPDDELTSTDAEAQHGLGVKLAVESAPKAFTKMIWVVEANDATNTRYYSTAQIIEGIAESSSITVYGAFGNGTEAAGNIVDVKAVDAIFTADDGVTSYFTNEIADKPNGPQE